MFLKSVALAGLILTAACSIKQSDPFMQPMFGTIPAAYEAMPVGQATTKIAVLLPLSGKSATVGADMQKAAMMAEFDRRRVGAAVVFYDTAGTPQGAVTALEAAEKIKPAIIIGPVFSASVDAVKDEGPSVPVLSFTSDTEVVDDDIYTLALTIPTQVDRIVQFACGQGQKKLAVIGPENKVGEIVMNALDKAVKRCPMMEMVQVSLYNPKTVNFDPVIAKIAPQPIDSRRKDLTDKEKELLAKPITEKVDFDSLFVFEDGIKLQQVMSMLSYYDITPSDIPVYGLSSWGGLRMSELIGGYYPAMPIGMSADFNARFRQAFGTNPSALATYAYDSVSLGIVLGAQGMLQSKLLEDTGFSGVNGRFRLNSDGTNLRLLDMRQIKSKSRSIVIDNAPAIMPLRDTNEIWYAPSAAIEAEFEQKKNQIP